MITFINNSCEIEAFIYGVESLFLVRKKPETIISEVLSVHKSNWTKNNNSQASSLPETFRGAISETHSVVMIRRGKIKIFGDGISFCSEAYIKPEYLNEKFKKEKCVA